DTDAAPPEPAPDAAPQDAAPSTTDAPGIRPRDRVLALVRCPASRVAVTLVAMLVLVLVMPVLGYRVSVFLFTVLIMKVVTAQSWLATVLVAVVTSVVVFFVFHDL